MNFTEQQKYLMRGRVWAGVCVVCTIAAAFYAWKVSGITARMPVIIFGVVVAAIAGSLFYTPDYLHLNVNRTKRFRWQIKIRWRLIPVGLLIGLLSVSTAKSALIIVGAAAWLSAGNFVASLIESVPASTTRSTLLPFSYLAFSSFIFFSGIDVSLAIALSLAPSMNLLVAVALIAVAIHLMVVTWDARFMWWVFMAVIFGHAAVTYVSKRAEADNGTYFSCLAAIEISILSACFLVVRAQRRNIRNVNAALSELKEFTGYSDDKIRELWATSNEQLAKNWKDAQLDESDREKMTAWYRENSELYMFAISGYNLEYKRIRDSIKMLKYGRGASLDYGAGNGEIILELARRGNPAIYFDVDGTSMKFARYRAERRKLAVDFFHSKEDLAAAAQKSGLDTIFSFDVLEHLPDLPGELKFLASLLNPGGLMAFDVPAGSTKAHPMHLNHHLDIHAHMAGIGMVEDRSVWQRIPFRKQEKYVFRKPV